VKKTKTRRKRGKVDDAGRAKVKAFVDIGKTGKEIAKSLGLSVPTVQNIKKALGLVKERKGSQVASVESPASAS
jgi:hypothetical protein